MTDLEKAEMRRQWLYDIRAIFETDLRADIGIRLTGMIAEQERKHEALVQAANVESRQKPEF